LGRAAAEVGQNGVHASHKDAIRDQNGASPSLASSNWRIRNEDRRNDEQPEANKRHLAAVTPLGPEAAQKKAAGGRRKLLKSHDSAKEKGGFNLDFLPPDLELLPPGLGFPSEKLGFPSSRWRRPSKRSDEDHLAAARAP
jgi:hypothetical protein